MWDFSYLKLGTWHFKAMRESGRAGDAWDAKINLGITGSTRGFVGRDYGIEERYWGPSNFTF